MSYTENSLIEFVAAMSIKLDLNQVEKGDTWVTCNIGHLQNKLDEKIHEYWTVERDRESADTLVDIANFCMMLHHRHMDLRVRAAAKINRRDSGAILRQAGKQMESAMTIFDREGGVTSEEFRLAIHHVMESLSAVNQISHKGTKK